jgi:hypothetical protein
LLQQQRRKTKEKNAATTEMNNFWWVCRGINFDVAISDVICEARKHAKKRDWKRRQFHTFFFSKDLGERERERSFTGVAVEKGRKQSDSTQYTSATELATVDSKKLLWSRAQANRKTRKVKKL